MPTYYLEVGPLKEKYFTGISQVTASLAGEALKDTKHDIQFFVGRTLIAKQAVEELLLTRDGELLDWHLHRRPEGVVPASLDEVSAAIFPNRKTCRNVFSTEFQIIHDLSTLLTPQFHHQETIDWHANTIEQDMLSNTATFCVSESTRQDVLAYFPELRKRDVQTLHLAPNALRDVSDLVTGPVEPYVLVVGTIEPRKNVNMILEYISKNTAILSAYRFVFLGRFGWGDSTHALVTKYALVSAVDNRRVLFPGFVDESIKQVLVQHAQIVAYPSLFEGFGLPVLEALAQGVPCVTTRSSSIPEVGGSCAYYFDPFVEGDFEAVFTKALETVSTDKQSVRAACLAQAALFSWEKTYAAMMRTVTASTEAYV